MKILFIAQAIYLKRLFSDRDHSIASRDYAVYSILGAIDSNRTLNLIGEQNNEILLSNLGKFARYLLD